MVHVTLTEEEEENFLRISRVFRHVECKLPQPLFPPSPGKSSECIRHDKQNFADVRDAVPIPKVHPREIISLNAGSQKEGPKPMKLSVPISQGEFDCKDYKIRKGKALVLNNKDFHVPGEELADRAGSDVDASTISQRFNDLPGFDYELESDFTKAETLDWFQREKEKLKTDPEDCLVLVILSHGNEDGIYATDQLMKTTELVDVFNATNCPELMFKPKVFIFQVCTGTNLSYGANVAVDKNQADCKGDDRECKEWLDMKTCMKTIRLPKEADFLVAYAADPGQSSHDRPYKIGQSIFYLHQQTELSTVFSDEEIGVISDGVIMDDGRLVLYLFDTRKLLICNTDVSEEDSIQLQYQPYNVTAVNNSTVAVTLMGSDVIEMYYINNKHKLKSIPVPRMGGWSDITTINNKLVVCGENFLYIIDHHTGEIQTKYTETIHKQLESWTKKEKMFVEIRASHFVIESINTNSCVKVTVHPGTDISYVVRHVGLQMAGGEYDVIHQGDINVFDEPKRRMLLAMAHFAGDYVHVVDDICRITEFGLSFLGKHDSAVTIQTLIYQERFLSYEISLLYMIQLSNCDLICIEANTMSEQREKNWKARTCRIKRTKNEHCNIFFDFDFFRPCLTMQQEPEVRTNVAQSPSKEKIQELQNACKPYLKRNVSDKIEKISRNQDESCSHQDIFIAKQGKSVPILDETDMTGHVFFRNDDFEVIDALSFINDGGKRENRKQVVYGGTIKWSETVVCPEADIHCIRTPVSSNKVWIEMDKGEEKADLMEDKNSNFVKINRKENVLIHEKERVEDYVENCISSENIAEVPFGEAGVQPIHLCKDDFVHVVERTTCEMNIGKSQVCVEKSDPFGSGICTRSFLHSESDNNDDKEGNKGSKIIPIIDHGDHTDLRKGTRSFNVSNSICIDILLILLLLPSFVLSSYTREENDTVCSQQLRSKSASNEMIDYQKESSRSLLQKDYSSYEEYLGFLFEERLVVDVLIDTCISYGVTWDVEFFIEIMEVMFCSFDHESWEKAFSLFYEEHLEMRILKLRRLTGYDVHQSPTISLLCFHSNEDVLFPYFDDCCGYDDEEYNIKETEEYDNFQVTLKKIGSNITISWHISGHGTPRVDVAGAIQESVTLNGMVFPRFQNNVIVGISETWYNMTIYNMTPETLKSRYILNIGEKCQTTRILEYYNNLPILLANQVGAGFQETCPLDPGLMILLYQIKTNSGLRPIFTSSTHSIFNEELPALLNLFCDRKFEELRQKWSDIIQWRRNSFYGMDTEVMMPPFSGLLHYMYHLTCTSTTCPANNRIFCMPDIRLSTKFQVNDHRRQYVDRKYGFQPLLKRCIIQYKLLLSWRQYDVVQYNIQPLWWQYDVVQYNFKETGEYNIREAEEYNFAKDDEYNITEDDTPVVENLNVYQHWVWGFHAKKNPSKPEKEKDVFPILTSSSGETLYKPLAPDLKSKVLLDLSQLKAFSQDVPQRKKSSKKKRTERDTPHASYTFTFTDIIQDVLLNIELIILSMYGTQFLHKIILNLEPWAIEVILALPCIVILAVLIGFLYIVARAKLQQLYDMEWINVTRLMNSISYKRSEVFNFSRSAIHRVWRFLLSTGKCFAGFAKNILFWMTKMIFRTATSIDYKLLFMQIRDVLMIFVKVMKKLVRIIIVIIEAVGKEYQLNDFDDCGNESCLNTFKTLNTDDAEKNELESHSKLGETTEYKERCSTENKGVQVNLINVGWNTTEFQSSCQGQISATEMSNNSCDPTVTYSSIGNEEIIHMKSKEGSTYTDKDGKVKIDIISNNMIDATNHDTTLQDSCKNNYNSADEKICFVSASIGNHDNRNETEHFVSPNDLEYDSLRNEEKNKFYKKEKIMLRDLSLSSSVTTEHYNVLQNNDIHAETAVKGLYVDPDDSNYMNVELTDSVELSIDEFNNSDRRHCVGKTANGSTVQMCTDNAENESIHSSRSSEMEDYTEQTNNDVDSFHEDYNTTRFNTCSKIWSSPSYNKFCLEKDTELCYSMKSGMSDITSNSLKVDKSFSSSLHSGSCCSCLTDTHVYNCQFEIQHHSGHQVILDCKKDDTQLVSSTVIDLQKRQESKSQSLEKQTKPFMNEQEKKVTMRDDEIPEHVKNTITNLVGEEIPKVTKRLKSGKRCSKRCRKAAGKRMSRRRLRRILYPLGNICNVKTDIEARPHLNVPQTNAASNRHARELDAAAAVALPRPVLTTSLPSSTNSLNSYFTKMMSGHEFSTEEKMQYEMLRVQSFQDLPASCRASPLRLARTGFFSTGISDEVNCFSCGVRYKGWQGGDNPSEIHRRISPDCRMVNGRETRNIPAIPPSNGIIESSAHQESLANSSIGLVQTTIHPDGDMSTQTVSNRALTREEIQNGNVADTTLQSRNAIQQPFANQQYTRQPAIDRSHSVTEGEQNRPAHRDTAEELGITLDRPKYPAYAQLNVRVSTFQGWPGYLDQTPRDMALAGFFYAGYNDYCRCFFCGGGLRNWDAGDDPWVEHARWFSKCAFVRQNRGHRFVEIIVKRQAEMEAAGNTSGSASSHTSVTHSETESRNQTTAQAGAQSGEKSSTNDPAVESVKEIGYSDEIIQRAISIIRQSNPGKERIEATEILEIIFTIADDNNTQTNAAVPSDNTPESTLNLPGQQVSQPNVSSVPVSTQSASNQRPGVPSQAGNAAESSLPSLSVSSLELGNAGSKSEQSGAGKEISENDIRSLQEENIQLKEQVMCKICMDKNVSIAFLPCGHLACCIDCAPAMRKCPMCRVYIKGTVKTYLA